MDRLAAKTAVVLVAVAAIAVIGDLQVQDHQRMAARSHEAALLNARTPLGSQLAGVEVEQPDSALFVGDSYTAWGDSYATRTCTAMRWTCHLDAQGSTGYSSLGHKLAATNTRYLGRLKQTKAAVPDVDYIFVSGGRNDDAKIRTRAPEYIRAVRLAWPHARIFVLSPFWNVKPAPTGIDQYRAWVQEAAQAVGTEWIDTDGWLKPSLIGPDTVHPTSAGQQALTDHLVTELNRRGLPDKSAIPAA